MSLSTPDGMLRVLTVREVAERIGLSVPVLDRMRAAGEGPPWVRLSARRIGYRLSDLRAWLDSRIEYAAPRMDAPLTPPAAVSPSAPI